MSHMNSLSKVNLADADFIVVVFEVILKGAPLSTVERLDDFVKIVASSIMLLLELNEVNEALAISRHR